MPATQITTTANPSAGNLSIRVRVRAGLANHRIRIKAIAVLVPSLAILWIAATLTPSPEGIGTHRQLGYPACLSPILTGHPCPTCGMTTAFAHAIRGNFPAAFHAQPAGLIGFVVLGAIILYSLKAFLTNKFAALPGFVHTRNVIVFVAGTTVLGWVYKLLTFGS